MTTIDQEWRTAIDRFIAAERVEHLARRVDSGPWQLTADQLVDYAEVQDWKRETRRGRQTAFKVFYDWAHRKGHVQTVPTADLTRIKPGDPNPMPVPDGVYLAALAQARFAWSR